MMTDMNITLDTTPDSVITQVSIMGLTTSEKIRILAKRRNLLLSELAKNINMSPQNFSNQLIRDNFKEEDLLRIAEALNSKLDISFKFDNGNII